MDDMTAFNHRYSTSTALSGKLVSATVSGTCCVVPMAVCACAAAITVKTKQRHRPPFFRRKTQSRNRLCQTLMPTMNVTFAPNLANPEGRKKQSGIQRRTVFFWENSLWCRLRVVRTYLFRDIACRQRKPRRTGKETSVRVA